MKGTQIMSPVPRCKKANSLRGGGAKLWSSHLGASRATTGVNGHHVAVRDGALAQTIGP